MHQSDFAPRALLVRPTIPVELYPAELSRLIHALEADAIRAAENPDQEGYADWLFRRCAALREAGR